MLKVTGKSLLAALSTAALISFAGPIAVSSVFKDGSSFASMQAVAATSLEALKLDLTALSGEITTIQNTGAGTATQKSKLAQLGRLTSQLRNNVQTASSDPGELAFLSDEYTSLLGQFTKLKGQLGPVEDPLLPGPGPTFDVKTLRPTFQQFTAQTGNFQLRSTSRIIVDLDDAALMKVLTAPMGWVQKLRYATGLPLTLAEDTPRVGDIVLSGTPDRTLLVTADSARNVWDKSVINNNGQQIIPPIVDSVSIKDNVLREGYTYAADANNVTLTYNNRFGAIRALQTLYQLLASDQRTAGTHRWLPFGTAIDYPYSEHRGVMFDVGRKFVSVDDLIAYMDKMSLYKLNILHFHLSDNAANAQGTMIGFFRLYDESMSPEFKLLKPTDSPSDGADRTYYTKADIARLEDAAEIYGIEIMPEIDNPGHAKAIVAVNPSFGTPADPASIDVTNMAAKAYIKKLLPEVATWFRSGKWQFGGDEVYGTPVAQLTAYINDMNTSLKATVGPKLFGVWSGANNLENLNNDIVWFDWTGEEPRANTVNRKNVGYWGMYLVPFNNLYQPGQMPDGFPYKTWGWTIAVNKGIPIGREIAVWNDNALKIAYGFDAMNAGIRLGLTGHGLSLWNGALYDATSKMIPYESIPAFKTSVSQEQSSYWIKSKYPSLSVAQSLTILLDSASYRNFNAQGTTLTAVAPADKAAWALKDPLGWDPLDMAAAYAKAQQLAGTSP